MAQVIISMRVRDSEGAETTIPHYFDTAEISDLTEAQAMAVALKGVIDGVAGAKVVSASVSFEIPTGVVASIVAGSRIDAGANLQFRTAINKRWSFYIPAFLTSKISGGVVELGDAQVVAYADLLTNVTTPARNDETHALVSLSGGKQTTR